MPASPSRAKFRCIEVTERYSHTVLPSAHNGNVPPHDVLTYRVKLVPVYGTGRNGKPASPENDAFYAATPAGQVELEVVAEATARGFVPGHAYYLDFTPTEG